MNDELHSLTFPKLLAHLSRAGSFGYWWTATDTRSYWWHTNTPAPLPNVRDNIYFGVHPTTQNRGIKHRSTIETIAAINCVFAEFDAKDFQGDKQQVLKHILHLDVQPTIIIDSGGGYHCYWLLDVPFLLDSDSARERAKALQRAWVKKVGGDDAAKDLARVLRVPGTLNLKYDPPRPVKFLFSDFERLYQLDDLEATCKPLHSPARTNGNGNHEAATMHATANAPYVRAALEGELATFRAAHNGSRNAQLNKSAFALGQFVGAGVLDRAQVENELYHVADEIGYVKDDGERATRATIKSGLDKGEKQPRAIPEAAPHQHNGQGAKIPMQEKRAATQWQPLDAILTAFERGEAGDAELFAQMYADQLAYDHSEKHWYFFGSATTPHAWQRDRTGQITHRVTNQLAAQYLQSQAELKARADDKDADRIKELYKRANVLRFKGRIDRVLDLAAKNPLLALTGDEWHQDAMLLAVSNGVLNLRAQEFDFRPGAPRDYLRDVVPTEWQGIDTPALRWETFLDEIFAGDTALVAFVQRLLGYGLTGLASEDKFPIFWGEGRNGKNTLFETLEHVLSSALAIPVQSEVLVDAGRNPNAATPHLIAMRGKRLVWVDETREGAFLNVGQVKMLTGGGTIAARPMYGASTTFRPTHLLMLMTNHKPHANADDYAFWQRALLIPFTQAFVDNPTAPNEHPKDANLKEKLRGEAPGILAWLVRGALEWQQHGLKPPTSVLAATNEYRTKEDTIAEFIAEKCVTTPEAIARAQEIYTAYEQWTGESGYKAMGKRTFGERMAKRFERGHDNKGNFFRGIGIREGL